MDDDLTKTTKAIKGIQNNVDRMLLVSSIKFHLQNWISKKILVSFQFQNQSKWSSAIPNYLSLAKKLASGEEASR